MLLIVKNLKDVEKSLIKMFNPNIKKNKDDYVHRSEDVIYLV